MPGEGNRIRQPGSLVNRLESAGFVDAHEIEEMVNLPFRDPETWWRSLWTHGSRAALDALTPDELAEIRVQCLERVQRMATPDEIPEVHHFVYVLASKKTSP